MVIESKGLTECKSYYYVSINPYILYEIHTEREYIDSFTLNPKI